MNVKTAIEERRAYRSIRDIEVRDDLIKDLSKHAGLAPSCFNKQPWQFVFVRDKEKLNELHGALSKGNQWAESGSLIVAVLSKRDDDCVIKEREYFLFDTGMAAGYLILRATELGLVAHPIAGYSHSKAKEILGIPDIFQLITLVIVGKKTKMVKSGLSEKQRKSELERPVRKSFDEFSHLDYYKRK